jgi:hypothetical protein
LSDLEHGIRRGMSQWWWYSVPYSLFFLATTGVVELFGTSGWALGHSAFFVIFLLVAILTSVSSGLWLVTAIYQVVNGSLRVSTRILVMLILSAIPTLFLVSYIWPQLEGIKAAHYPKLG